MDETKKNFLYKDIHTYFNYSSIRIANRRIKFYISIMI